VEGFGNGKADSNLNNFLHRPQNIFFSRVCQMPPFDLFPNSFDNAMISDIMTGLQSSQ
jgi:hypothetical protein